jgi:hypothetical protein
LHLAQAALDEGRSKRRAILLVSDAEAGDLLGPPGQALRDQLDRLAEARLPVFLWAMSDPRGKGHPYDPGPAGRTSNPVDSGRPSGLPPGRPAGLPSDPGPPGTLADASRSPDHVAWRALLRPTGGDLVAVSAGDGDVRALFGNLLAGLPGAPAGAGGTADAGTDPAAPARAQVRQEAYRAPLAAALGLGLLASWPMRGRSARGGSGSKRFRGFNGFRKLQRAKGAKGAKGANVSISQASLLAATLLLLLPPPGPGAAWAQGTAGSMPAAPAGDRLAESAKASQRPAESTSADQRLAESAEATQTLAVSTTASPKLGASLTANPKPPGPTPAERMPAGPTAADRVLAASAAAIRAGDAASALRHAAQALMLAGDAQRQLDALHNLGHAHALHARWDVAA